MNKSWLLLGVILSASTLSGCAGLGQVVSMNDVSINELKAINEMRVLKETPSSSYTSIGRLKGLSCKGSSISGESSEEAAMTQLKINAVRANADAVLYPVCSHDASVDWGNNCWNSWVCIGEGISFK